MIDLKGIHVPAITPFRPSDGEVDHLAFRANLERWARHPVHGIVMAGTTGEAVLLDPEERIGLISTAREVLPDGILLSVGTGIESTRATLRLSRQAADAGADAVLVQPPAYYRGAMTPQALLDHYRTVADDCPVPVIIYQAPLKVSSIEFPTEVVVELSEHPNVVGVKESRGKVEIIEDLVSACVQGFQVLVGSGALLKAGMEKGAVGGIIAVANPAPRASGDLFQACEAGKMPEAGVLQERLAGLHNELVAGIGVPGIKVAMDLLGYYGGDPRPPLRPLPAARVGEIEDILRRAGLNRDAEAG